MLQKDVPQKITWTKKLIGEIIFICILAVIIISATSVIYHFYEYQVYQVEVGRMLYFYEQTRFIDIKNVNQKIVLHGHLGIDIPQTHLPYDCSNHDRRGAELCRKWTKEASLNITYFEENSTSCFTIEWKSLAAAVSPHDCYQLTGGRWYGGGLRNNQQWPIDKMEYVKNAFLPGNLQHFDRFGPLIERYWLSSQGVAIFVEDDSPLFVSMNATDDFEQLCLFSSYDNSHYPQYYRDHDNFPKLNYTVCVAADVKQVHNFAIHKFATPSLANPEEKYLQYPVWSTSAQLGPNLTQRKIEEFATSISAGYKYSMLVIDNGWQARYGDLQFDDIRFPDVQQMLIELRNMSFDIGIAVHPFLSTDSSAYQHALAGDHCVLDASGQVPGLSQWYKDSTEQHSKTFIASIDMNSAGSQWWTLQLKLFLTEYGPMHFSMHHSDLDFLPYQAIFREKYTNPGQYTQQIAQLVTNVSQNGQVRSVYKSQDQPLIVFLGNGNSTWQGLQTVLPAVLHTGIIGYPFVLPDTVGGNCVPDKPSSELYIRWLQLNTFLPIMHFSIHPNQYDASTQAITKAFIHLRDTFVAARLIELAQVASESMVPIVRPLWWHDPTDPNTYSIDDEFLLGDDVLVAPVLTAATIKRDVYLPNGSWQEQNTRVIYVGPGWQYNLHSPLNSILYFVAIL